VGKVLLGIESEEDTRYFNQHSMGGLADISEVVAEDLAATKEEDKIAQEVINNQNIIALLTAAVDLKLLSKWSASGHSASPFQPRIESKVTFSYRSEERDGIVKEISGRVAKVEFIDGGRQIRRRIPLNDVAEMNAAEEPRCTSSDADDGTLDSPEMFDGQRHRFEPTTTSIISVLTGQEFMPTMMNEFFSRLKGEDELPIIPALAIGHTMKGLSVSMMAYYKCFFDPMLEAMGVKPGSPEHKRYYKGSVIRKTNDLVTNFMEMLAVAAAHQYLSPDVRVERDPTIESVVVMDSNMRPMSVSITKSLRLIAEDFQIWSREKWGTTRRNEVGPSGFERKSPSSTPQQDDIEQLDLSKAIEEDTPN